MIGRYKLQDNWNQRRTDQVSHMSFCNTLIKCYAWTQACFKIYDLSSSTRICGRKENTVGKTADQYCSYIASQCNSFYSISFYSFSCTATLYCVGCPLARHHIQHVSSHALKALRKLPLRHRFRLTRDRWSILWNIPAIQQPPCWRPLHVGIRVWKCGRRANLHYYHNVLFQQSPAAKDWGRGCHVFSGQRVKVHLLLNILQWVAVVVQASRWLI